MAPKKGKDPEPPPPPAVPVEEDPAMIAARELRERHNEEERRAFERSELVDRRRVEGLENAAWRCVVLGRERRVDPAAYAARMGVPVAALSARGSGPGYVHVKVLSGNRAVPQRALRVAVPDDSTTTVKQLRELVCAEAALAVVPAHPAISTLFAAEHQHYIVGGKPLPDDAATNDLTLRAAGIFVGSTVHLSVDAPMSVRDIMPSMIRAA